MKGLEEFGLTLPDPHFAARASVARIVEAEKNRLLARIREITGNDIPEDRLFTWQAEISNRSLDAYHTRMAESSLKNYAADAETGVVFLDSHDHKQRIGYSLAGAYEDGEEPRVLAEFYTVRGLNLADLPTDNFVEGVMYGLIRDVSIGFKEGEGFQYTCSICRQNIFSWDCEHIPGFEYEVISGGSNPDDDPTGDGAEEVVRCFAWIENARLSEVSAVYDGATPNAMIIKATRELRGGRLRAETRRMLETTYRIQLPETPKNFRVPDLKIGDDTEMAGEKPSGAPDNNRIMDGEARLIARESGLKLEGEPDTLGVCRAMSAEIERLRPFEALAHDGRVLRDALVEEALSEGVRAFGNDFNREAKKAMLEGSTVEMIRELRDSWKGIGDSKLTGGRRSVEDPDNPDGKKGENEDGDEKPNGDGADTTDDEELPVPEDSIGNV